MKTFIASLISALVAAVVVYFALSGSESVSTSDEQKPLYWVAPMDPNFKSDKPGKSPMGMDLIPVYEEADTAAEPGTVTLSGRVRNQLSIQTATARQGELPISIQAAGYLEFNQESQVHIHPRISGWLKQIFVSFDGEEVKQGAPLYAIYSPELVNAQEEYLLALNSQDPQLLELAKQRLQAFEIHPQQIETLRKSRQVKQQVMMLAPQSGFVQNLSVRPGMYVKPEQELMTLVQLDEIWVMAEIPERQSSLLELGAKAHMQVTAMPEQRWQGRLDYIYPSLNPKTRTLKARLRFANPKQTLKPNMLASLSIETKAREPQVLIPQQALIRDGIQDRVVLALGDGNFRSTPVTVGLGNGEQIEILEGLEGGQKVVISGQFLIDSESNLSAAESRISPEEAVDHVWVTVAIRAVAEQEVTLAHPPIESWGWPKMVMDFTVKAPETTHGLKPVHYIRAKLSKVESGEYWVSEFDRESMEPVFPDEKPAPAEESEMQDHSQMDHSQHQAVDHSSHQNH